MHDFLYVCLAVYTSELSLDTIRNIVIEKIRMFRGLIEWSCQLHCNSRRLSRVIAEEDMITATIFSITGGRVRTLACGECHAGGNSIQWDGKDEQGNAVPSGVYYYELRFDGEFQTRKMIVAR